MAGAVMTRSTGRMAEELGPEALATLVWALSRAEGVCVPEVLRKEMEEAAAAMLAKDAQGMSVCSG